MFQFDLSYVYYKGSFMQEYVCKDTQDDLVS